MAPRPELGIVAPACRSGASSLQYESGRLSREEYRARKWPSHPQTGQPPGVTGSVLKQGAVTRLSPAELAMARPAPSVTAAATTGEDPVAGTQLKGGLASVERLLRQAPRQ